MIYGFLKATPGFCTPGFDFHTVFDMSAKIIASCSIAIQYMNQ